MDYRTIVALLFVAYALAEAGTGRLLQPGQSTIRDWLIELGSGLGLPLVVIPGVFTLAPLLVETSYPGSANTWADWPWYAMLAVLLVADDLTQYLYHRAAHSFAWLFRLHRAHHSASYLSVRVTYRNNFFYYAMMPGLWLSAALVHLGFGPVYAVYAVVKMFVILGAHSSVPWDAWLIARPRWWPLLWVLERVISTPATHAAHHGRHATDGATYYRGNYGNLLFFWDVLFGTAKITRRRPRAYGLENVAPIPWLEELAWPLFSGRPQRTRSSAPTSTGSTRG